MAYYGNKKGGSTGGGSKPRKRKRTGGVTINGKRYVPATKANAPQKSTLNLYVHHVQPKQKSAK